MSLHRLPTHRRCSEACSREDALVGEFGIINTMISYALINDLRSGVSTLPEFLAQVETRFLEREPSIQAFIPEQDRFSRLHDEAATLLLTYPDLVNRPLLFGALVGVKDIFHVEGFTTQAG